MTVRTTRGTAVLGVGLAMAFAGVVGLQPPRQTERPPATPTASSVPFAIMFGELTSSLRILTVSVLPGQTFAFRARAANPRATFDVRADSGSVRVRGERMWEWRAPRATGRNVIALAAHESPDTMFINAFVTVPRQRIDGEHLNGYRLGRYPPAPRIIYRPPPGYIEVTRANLDVPVSPNFTLRQFVAKQVSDYPKYVVLEPALLLKLEILLDRARNAGYTAKSFYVMSGYRTPHYNRSIGNSPLSRHIWGAAADVFIDDDGDGVMDDINHDGRRDVADAVLLRDLVDREAALPYFRPLIGGGGTYEANARHGPFLHIDVRGRRTRWRR